MLNRQAVFSDETLGYRLPQDFGAGDFVTLRIRAGKGEVEEARIKFSAENPCGGSLRGGTPCDGTPMLTGILTADMKREESPAEGSSDRFDWFSCQIVCGSDSIFYWFELTDGEETVLYDRTGCHDFVEAPFEMIPGFSVPDWARGAVMYQIFTDRFANGDPSNDPLTNEYIYLKRPIEHAEWDRPVSSPDFGVFYGGDLEGVRKKFDYLRKLGVEVLYFNPLFVSPSSHGYDTQDYDHIDPHFTGFAKDEGELLTGETQATHAQRETGSNIHATRYICRTTDPENLAHADAYFAQFMKEAHEKGFKVILDGVFNHCGSFHRWMDRERIYETAEKDPKGAFVSADSPYRDYFIFNENPSDKEHEYVGWWENITLPKLNYEGSRDLRDSILTIAKKWVSEPYNADGWRLDVAADLGRTGTVNHAFWRDFRQAVKAVKPDALLLAEHYGDPSPWLHGEEWDTVMNYDAFMDPVSYFLTGTEKHSNSYDRSVHGNGDAFFRDLRKNQARLPIESLQTAMNELSNHDHTRFLTRTSRTVGTLATKGSAAAGKGVSYATFREGIVMQFTMPGAPTIYYGDETGMVGWTDPDNRRPFPWGHENWDLIAFHRDLIKIHKAYSCFRTGSFLPILSGFGFVVYGRFDSESAAVVIVNHSIDDNDFEIPVWMLEIPENGTMLRAIQTNDAGYNIGHWEEEYRDGLLKVRVPAWSSTVYAMRKPGTD